MPQTAPGAPRRYLVALGTGIAALVFASVLFWPDSSTRASFDLPQPSVSGSNPAYGADNGYVTPGKIAPDVTDALSSASSVSVIVSLGKPAPSAVVPPVDVSVLAQGIASSAARVLGSVPPSEFGLAHQYQAVPALAGDATAAGVWALAAQPDVVHVALNREVQATLAQAVPLIGADDVHNILGITGDGVVVAVLDTGIDTDHPALVGDINHQQCFLDSGTCPGGGTTGPSAEDDAGHGSHVSGIITSTGPPVGIAPDALIDAFKVLDSTGSGFFSDVILAYDEIILNHPEVDVINVSIGDGGSHAPGSCESLLPAFTTAITVTRAMGITTFASSGNNGSKSGIGFPACINDIVSVGAVYDDDVGFRNWGVCTDATTAADKAACFSQSNISLDLLAPGSTIDSTVPGGGLGNKSGTSMASPAAAASAALLLESEPLLTPAAVQTRLTETGVPVTDAGNGVTTCRVDAYEAVLNDGGPICASSGPPPPANDDFVNAFVVPEPLPYTNTQLTTSATTEVGEPAACGGIASTVWYTFTPTSNETLIADTFGSAYDTVLTIHTGPSVGSLTLVGCNDDTAGLQSQVQFSATAGTTYRIQVGGFSGAAGSLTLNLNTFVVPTCPGTPAFSFSVPDPVGDNFGIGSPNHDITSVDGEGDASTFCLTVGFAGPVDPADAGSGLELAGVIEFDTDQSAGTGAFPFMDIFCANSAGMGVEASLDMFSVSGGFGLLSGTPVPVTFGATSFTAIIPLALIGGDTAFNFGMVLGGVSEPTDCAPGDGGFIKPLSPPQVACNEGNNNDFELGVVDSNQIPCWTVVDQLPFGGPASWCTQAGTSAPAGDCGGGITVQTPPQGVKAAMTAMSAPGSHVLYRCNILASGSVSFQLYINNGLAGVFSNPPTLDANVSPNQQFRADLVTKAGIEADPFTVSPSDVLLNIYQTLPGDPSVSAYTLVAADISAFVGQNVCLRFAEVDNQAPFHVGIDDVQFELKKKKPGDTDGDGCADVHENGPDETLGGQRDYKNPWDFYDINGDQVIDLSNDIFDVIQHYAPTGTEPEYDVNFDRGPSSGPNVWNLTAPDGVIDLTNDIFGVIQQYFHDCS